jgi:hypothetical protein
MLGGHPIEVDRDPYTSDIIQHLIEIELSSSTTKLETQRPLVVSHLLVLQVMI